ncbi:hypothetical protein J6590_108287 [Homalodisca vitripennis]|nr:hypothetical protein J6590_108287 [Homalodisca vitripennis]
MVLQVFRSYFTDRKQILCTGGAHSQPQAVKYGVPQGSVIGPVLFLITINDISQLGDMLLFADDTSIFARGDTPENARLAALQTFTSAKEWFAANGLCLNEGKTQEMMCTLSRSDNNFGLSEVKLLGFILDPGLTWRSHTNSVCIRLSRALHLLRRLKPMLTNKYLLTVYFAMFHSHISYGLHIWGHAAGCKDILLLQKKALRVISPPGFLDSCRPIFVSLKILTVYGQYILSCLTNLKLNISDFAERNELHTYNTRKKHHLDVPFCRLSKKKNCYPSLALRMYNALPDNLKELNPPHFETQLKSWLLCRPFYSVGEFFDALS